MSFTIDDWGTDDVIDSRDIIERHQELETEYDDLKIDLEVAQEARDTYYAANPDDEGKHDPSREYLVDVADATRRLTEWVSEYLAELEAIRTIVKQGESYGDWQYGETLIKEDWFEAYTHELINDCYPSINELRSNDWPYRHITIDIEAAADELKGDYTEVELNGYTYLMRAT